jgi:putative transposase
LTRHIWRTVKYEEVYLKAYESVAEARSSIGRYLEFYNGRRPHSALDRRTPDQAYYASLPPLHGSRRAHRGSACKLTRAA